MMKEVHDSFRARINKQGTQTIKHTLEEAMRAVNPNAIEKMQESLMRDINGAAQQKHSQGGQ